MGKYMMLRQDTKEAIMQLAHYFEDIGNLKQVHANLFLDTLLKSVFSACHVCGKPVIVISPCCHACGTMVEHKTKTPFLVDVLRYCSITNPCKKSRKDWNFNFTHLKKYRKSGSKTIKRKRTTDQ